MKKLYVFGDKKIYLHLMQMMLNYHITYSLIYLTLLSLL